VRLTNQLVNKRSRGAGAAATRGRSRRRDSSDDSRDRIFAAAAREFAARGFAATSVDRIAAAARLNKAMIYYHFKNKAVLYREVLRDMFDAVGARVRSAALSDLSPSDKIRRFVEAFAAEAEARPHFPPMWFREIADGGTHLDDTTFGSMAVALTSITAIVDEGVRAGAFKPIPPMLVHAGIVAPVLLFFASAALRERIEKAGVRGPARLKRDEVVAHVQRVAIGLLEGRVV
jgi:TetR/AcrR family transcriptional regulator